MAGNNTWPTVQPLPRFVVQLVLALFFVAGHVLLWNDRRVAARASLKVEKSMGLPAYK